MAEIYQEDYTWVPLKDCTKLLNNNRYACFSHPEHSLGKEEAIPPERAHFYFSGTRGKSAKPAFHTAVEAPAELLEEDAEEIKISLRQHGTIPISVRCPDLVRLSVSHFMLCDSKRISGKMKFLEVSSLRSWKAWGSSCPRK